MKKSTNDNIEFGKRLKKFRTERQLSAEAVAQQIGVAESTLRDWENGRAVSGQPYVKMANTFQVSLHELMGMSDPRAEVLLKISEIESLLQEIRLRL